MATHIEFLMRKIKAKQERLDSIERMFVRYAQELDKNYNDLLSKNNIDLNDYEKYYSTKIKDDNNLTEIKDDNNSIEIKDDINTNNQSYNYDLQKLCNNLYRNLALKTHPDKSNHSTDFVNITQEYENSNVITLIEYSNKYELDYSTIDICIDLILEQTLHLIKKKLTHTKSTVAYQLLMGENIDCTIQCIKDIIDLRKKTEILEKDNIDIRERVEKLEQNHVN